MITHLLFDFSRTLLFPYDEQYSGSLNQLYKQIQQNSQPFDRIFYLNTDLLNWIDQHQTNFTFSIFTTGIVQTAPEITDKLKTFQNIYTVNDIGFPKNDPQAYHVISHQLQSQPDSILFIDDESINLTAAEQVGFKTHHYTNNQSLISFLETLNLKPTYQE